MKDVRTWLGEIGLAQYADAFEANDVEMDLLKDVDDQLLKDIGVMSAGHRLRIRNAIAKLTPTSDVNANSAVGGPDVAPASGERRPLSVMFCDLVGSTALSSRLDPEDLRDVIRAYQTCVATTIQQFHGFIARYVGDGVLIYFGWPEAGETDAAQAVRAALAVAAAVSAAPVGGEPLHVRVGIATGLVVIGEPIGSGDSRQQTAVGETPNLAARLQGLAEPNRVVIDAATRRQIGGLFACEDLGTVDLKGLPAGVRAWRVLSENRTIGQFEALRSGASPMVGREQEMALLLRCWAEAKAGEGRVVLISAEPGIGKSRVAEALEDRIATEPHLRLRYFCSSHHQDSALYAVIAQMERAAGFAFGDQPADKVAKLQTLLAATAPPIEDVALIAEMHSLPSADLVPPRDLTPQRKKDKTFEALLRQVEGLARQHPVLLVFDDLHWIDPSSRELLDRLIERVPGWPILLLVMFRPEFRPPWIGQPHVTMLTLGRLDRRGTAEMVANIAGNAVLPPEFEEEIARRTDGVPLFVEELTKAVLESGAQMRAALSSVPHPSVSVPATLHASLMARLDRLGPSAKDVAPAGAAIGREFGYNLLTSVIDLPEPQVREALDRLVDAGLVFVRGTPPEANYLFKHALVQDAAYGILLRGRRQSLHRRIVATLEERFPEIVQTQPATLAHHCTAAGLAERAVDYWLKAGQRALGCSAMAEAVMQVRNGLEILTTLPDSPWRQQQELTLRTALTSALIAMKGWGATEVAEAHARAWALLQQTDQSNYLMLLGQWGSHFVQAEHRLGLPLAKQIEQIGEARNDVSAQLLGHYTHGITRFWLGDLVAARALLERCMGLAEPAHRTTGGSPVDYYAAMLVYLALTLAYQGYLDQAQLRMNDALSEARRLKHAHTLVHVLGNADWLGWIMGQPGRAHIAEVLALATEHRFPYYLGWAHASRGWALIELGQAQEGLILLKQGLTELRPTGTLPGMPILLISVAEAHALLRQPAEAWNWLAEAVKFVEATDERLNEADLLRVSADLLNTTGDQSAAESHYRQAIGVAERQSAKLPELRASMGLARLLRDLHRRTEAHNLLMRVYCWFTEGHDAPILKEAKALLDELA